jgi:hypothetical protein
MVLLETFHFEKENLAVPSQSQKVDLHSPFLNKNPVFSTGGAPGPKNYFPELPLNKGTW